MSESTAVYPNNLKTWEFGKEGPQNFCSERETIAGRQGASENGDSEVNPTSPKTKSSSCLGKITTIIPTYKRPKLLRRALSSVLRQTYPYFEVHVYDNASGDETEEVVNEFREKDARVKYHQHPENIGMMGNYEFAMKEVKTPYFSVLSDDDLVLPWFFETALKGFESFPEVAFSAASTLIMSEKGEIVRVPLDFWPKEGFFSSVEGLTEMISKYPIPTCILFRKEVIDEVPIDRGNVLTWDCDFLLQVAARHPIFISKRPCGIFLHHDTSYSNAQTFNKWQDALKRISKRIEALEFLPATAKMGAINLIDNDLKICNRSFIIIHLVNKRFEESFNCAKLFRETYGDSFDSLILLISSKICCLFPLFVRLLLLIRNVKMLKKAKLFRSYVQYAKWLWEFQ